MDWWDMVSKEGNYKHPYRIQWDMDSGHVRAKNNEDEVWREAQCSIPAKYATTKGYALLAGGGDEDIRLLSEVS